MLFRKRINESLDINESIDIKDIEKNLGDREILPLEKGDLTAMLIAAAIVIGPIVLGLSGLLLLLAWLFGSFG